MGLQNERRECTNKHQLHPGVQLETRTLWKVLQSQTSWAFGNLLMPFG